MKNLLDVSIIIVNYNTKELTRNCLRSLLKLIIMLEILKNIMMCFCGIMTEVIFSQDIMCTVAR